MKWYLIALKQYANFEGRAKRKEYWGFLLCSFALLIISIILGHICGYASTANPVGPFFYLYLSLTFFPRLALIVRRLHDINKSGWWVLICLLPIIGWILCFIFMSMDSKESQQKYGVGQNNTEKDKQFNNNISIALIISSILWLINYFCSIFIDYYMEKYVIVESIVTIEGYEKSPVNDLFENIIYHLDSLLPILFFIFAVSLRFQVKNKWKLKSTNWLIVFSVYWICEMLIVWLWEHFNHLTYDYKLWWISRVIPLVVPIFLIFYAASPFLPNNKVLHKIIYGLLIITSCVWLLFFFSDIHYTISPVVWFEYIYMLTSFLQINIPIIFIMFALPRLGVI